MNREQLLRVKSYFENDYRERGKVKWDGFFLSDHTLQMKKHQQESTIDSTEMNLSMIMQLSQHAWANHRLVTVQINSQNLDGQFLPPVTGLIEEMTDQTIQIAGQALNWDEVLNIVEG
ncbi:hypothetical protein [Convivina praedatoris]|uniref:DNA-directed RNA polymerase beta subunit n=1 Tax=Convivina praedatoris TaxID=2880963 RepID=A0ABM9D1L2_9LACO|nr:hypothetical protein [Convivina sp. LMG 32447]CAH1851924.1 hypothetical protein R077815_00436 [Convivina sp. LMG 32447]CAH1853981.1 hypothetical protein LMG032447_00768 [Convivina sp. LMG 32447]CAH1854039.1 hypothetical protein R078138_00794 [Convivina sp. LMG 32447]